MRRSAGVVLSVLLLALLPALAPNVAQASPLSEVPYDFGTAAFSAVFGEASDGRASLAGSYGDLASESPLRDLAMTLPAELDNTEFVPLLSSRPTFAQERVASRMPSLVASNLAVYGGHEFKPSEARFVPVPFYAPVPSIPVEAPRQLDSPDVATVATTLDASPVNDAAPAAISFGNSAYSHEQNAIATGFAPTSVLVPVSMRLGRLQFDGHVAGLETQAAAPSQQDSAYDAGANFDVRAGGHRVNVDVSSSYEHLMRDDTIAYSSAIPASSRWEIGGETVPALPSYADMSKVALGANLAVPVTTTVTLGLNYNAQRLLGEYGLPGIENLDAIDNSYGGRVTLAIPRWSSQLSVSASQYHYQDNIAPANTFSDLRGNVDFTVKF
jgi:hypothetical protein